ncbi:MAG: HAMP domain-containing histidine kinase, partial [Proteobacteria bacterium]
LAVVLFSLRARARQADAVMKELSAGNLKARLQITKMDEVGQTMFSFNKMADEIEHLIEHLRKTENARKDLLRELAHDLRTPVASLKSLIETVSMRADQLPKEKLRDLLELAMKEAEYFEGLVDDLLFLGRVGEPKYKTKVENFDLADLVSLEVDSASTRYPEIEVTLQSSADVLEYDGDPSLIKRLVRNSIENAASFARAKVMFYLEVEKDVIVMRVSDDGPGFDATSLASFGQRKYSRAMTEVGGTKRISIGLGSVIMKSITDAHRGDLIAANRLSPSGDVLGAEVTMRLPRA